MQLHLKERCVTRHFFGSISELIYHLGTNNVEKLEIDENAKTSDFEYQLNYVGMVKYHGLYGYVELLYVDRISLEEQKELIAKLQAFSDELAQKAENSQQEATEN